MNVRRLLSLATVIFISTMGVAWAAPKPVELKLWSAWPEKMDPAKPGLDLLVSMINEKGKAVGLSVRYLGGPEIFSPFEGCESLQKGIVDMAYTAGAYNTGVVPEVDAMKLMQTKPWQDRKSGAFKLMNQWHNEKGLEVLARASSGQGFQMYLNKKVTKPDLTGIRMRVVPIYVPLVKALNGTGVNMAGGEVYTALERGTVDGFIWGGKEIRPWAWNEVAKYVWGPAFWTVDVHVMMNKAKWDGLDPAQRDVLTKIMVEYEHKTHDAQEQLQGEITQALLDGGMEQISFSDADQAKYIETAYRVGWEAAIGKSGRVSELRKLVAQ